MSNGFSLVELLITLSIIAIVSVIGIRSFVAVEQDSESHALMSQLLTAIQLTRSVAVTQNKKIMLCKSRNYKTCSGDWQDGFIITSDDHVFSIFENVSIKGVLQWRAFPLDRQQLEFLPTGLPYVENGTFWFCSKGAMDPRWAIMLNKSGRARVVYPNQDGQIFDSKGALLKC